MHAVNFALKYGKPVYALDCNWSGNRYLINNSLAEAFKPLWDDDIKSANQMINNISNKENE